MVVLQAIEALQWLTYMGRTKHAGTGRKVLLAGVCKVKVKANEVFGYLGDFWYGSHDIPDTNQMVAHSYETISRLKKIKNARKCCIHLGMRVPEIAE
jgi:hypothetical protein